MRGRIAGSRSREAPWTPARALRQECLLVAALAAMLSLMALAYCLPRGLLLLYGDAVAHLHIARRIFDSINPGFRQLGSVWLPLPHLLLLPFVQKMSWWQSGLAGAPPSMLAYVLGAAGLYRLARFWLAQPAAGLAAAFYAINPGLLYMQTTAMNEPLFLAEMIWAAVLLTELSRVLSRSPEIVTESDTGDDEGRRLRFIRSTLFWLALVLVAAVFTRYDGWVYAALAWCFVALHVFRSNLLRSSAGGAFVLFTAIVLAAPLFWLAYNQKQFHDPLDFMRGPYSAQAIERKTAAPNGSHYPGWHNWPMAAHYFLKAAELGAAPPLAGNVVLVFSIAGVVVAMRRRQGLAVLALFWLPWPFYAYSVAYGSVPIFIPPWEPHAWYNTRYGMELLPAFALSIGFAAHAGLTWVRTRDEHWAASALGLAALLIGLNAWALLRATPLVFAEAVANSRTRIPFESALARALAALPSEGRILMYTSDHIGAVEQAGIPLVRTINDTDWEAWNAALARPAEAAPYAVAIAGDAVAGAIAAHPEGLTLLDVVCSTGQSCARIYASARFPQSFYFAPAKPGADSGSIPSK